MGGGNKTTTKSNQATSSQSGPWSPAVSGLKSDISGIQGVSPIDTSSMSPQIQQLMQSIVSGDPNANPYTNQLMSTIDSNVWNTLGGQFAGAGRDVMTPGGGGFGGGGTQGSMGPGYSPGFAQAVARGISQGSAPTLFSNQLAMMNMLPQLAGSPYWGQNAKTNALLPIAQLGSTNKGTATGTSTTTLPTNPLMSGIGAGLGLFGLGMSPMPAGGWGNTLGGGILGL